jgi:membrane protease YdiL (CAAX protease family)
MNDHRESGFRFARSVTSVIIFSTLGVSIAGSIILHMLDVIEDIPVLFNSFFLILPSAIVIYWYTKIGQSRHPLDLKIKVSVQLHILLSIPLFVVAAWYLSDGLSDLILKIMPDAMVLEIINKQFKPILEKIQQLDTAGLLIYGVTMILFYPVVSEFVYRGIAFASYRETFGLNKGTVYSALLWAFLSMIPFMFLSYFIFGIILAYTVYRFNALWPAITIQIIFNLTEFIYLNTLTGDELLHLPDMQTILLKIAIGAISLVLAVNVAEYLEKRQNNAGNTNGSA